METGDDVTTLGTGDMRAIVFILFAVNLNFIIEIVSNQSKNMGTTFFTIIKSSTKSQEILPCTPR